jgi:hypothetical protein
MGCFALGCLTFLVIGFLFLIGIAGCTWYLCRKAADTFTSTESVNLAIVQPDSAQIRAAEGSLSRVKTAIATNQETTVGFTAADLNALIDQESEFEGIRGRVRIEIADSLMTIRVSAPLDEIPWKRLRGRWLNFTTALKFDYNEGKFDLDFKTIEANGHQISDAFLSGFVPSFNDVFNSRLHDELEKNNVSDLWDHVKSITLQDDKMVVTTQTN